MKQDSYAETSYETVKKEETISVLVLETFDDLYDPKFIKELKKLLKEYASVSLSEDSYHTLRLSKEFEEEIKGRLKVDEEILVRISNTFILSILNSDVRDSFGSFGKTVLYFSEYKLPKIYAVEDFQEKTNKNKISYGL